MAVTKDRSDLADIAFGDKNETLACAPTLKI